MIGIYAYNPQTQSRYGDFVPALVPSTDLVDWIERNITPADLRLWHHRAFPGLGLAATTWPTGFEPPRSIRVNRLVWPCDRATAWGYVHLLFDGNALNKLHPLAFGKDGSSYYQINFTMDSPPADGSPYDQLNAVMWMLPPTPLSAYITNNPQPYPGQGQPAEGTPSNNPYLITLVDDRFWWWTTPFLPMPAPGIVDSTKWTDLLNNINKSLSAYNFNQITMDAVDPAYLNVSPAFTLPYETVCPIIDALAFNVGKRFTRSFTGKNFIQSYKQAVTNVKFDFDNSPPRRQRAGHDRFQVALPFP